MGSILGLIFHAIGGFAAGSFYMPFKKVKGWSWESYWIVGGFFSWLIIPSVAAYFTISGFLDIINAVDGGTRSVTYLMGVLWGIGGLTYGLGIRYLGMSLGNSIVLGFCSAFGALVPSVYYNFHHVEGKTSFTDLLSNAGGRLVLFGVLICLFGIFVLGKAGMLKEKEWGDKEKTGGNKEFNLVKGLIIGVVSGILSAFFNFGIEAGKPMAEAAVSQGYNPLFQNNVSFVVILLGGFTTNFIWCTYLNIKNKSFKDYVNRKTPIASNILFSGLAGFIWFLQFFFYGMGESKLGNGASSWILHMATIILAGNLWGLYLKEWKNISNKTLYTFVFGIVLILVSIILVGIGNSI
tara:strand:- start:246835 stop:247887 length:1053 start_codon:yes stop_codon:yes gene_type:complete